MPNRFRQSPELTEPFPLILPEGNLQKPHELSSGIHGKPPWLFFSAAGVARISSRNSERLIKVGGMAGTSFWTTLFFKTGWGGRKKGREESLRMCLASLRISSPCISGCAADEVDEMDEVDLFSERVWMCTAFTPLWLRPRAALELHEPLPVIRRPPESLCLTLRRRLEEDRSISVEPNAPSKCFCSRKTPVLPAHGISRPIQRIRDGDLFLRQCRQQVRKVIGLQRAVDSIDQLILRHRRSNGV